ncbi:MAG TPA: tetratricopeptide repeat protein [Candidatus Polarisedimenticolia bacterium]|nr:tetratricopeptide repeat protein [Candidatus Polarisedimenticolia bacterium]
MVPRRLRRRGRLAATAACTLLLLIGIPGSVRARSKVKRGELHSFDELMKVMEKSSLTYLLDIDDNLPAPAIDKPRVLSANQLLTESDGHLTLTEASISKEANEVLKTAEEAFENEKFDTALELYKKVQEIAPDYSHLLTLVGDVYYRQGEYGKARDCFRQAIDRNFADYDAHWFLADAAWKVDDKSEAMQELTIAHILNVNHETLKKGLLTRRDSIRRPWKAWDYAPRYTLSRDGKQVKVTAQEDWLGYAVAKAIWIYEPGYAEKIAGEERRENVISFLEEKEALLGALGTNKKLKQVERIIDDGYVDELIYYEIVARQAPEALVLLPRDTFMRLVHYVDTYH